VKHRELEAILLAEILNRYGDEAIVLDSSAKRAR
jgi:hypothetical protein